ncbi:cytochrome c biogenesis protein CcsA [Ohtaekwangia koreensis]|uniref:Cytochrome c-type biogenesis protein CcmF n=1 Tax=Ohtaekwangia koreensis TaxID=688867 RepID=A0A1T5IHR3_9BACT|nr:cytochrome c biogenesis protein CcsA [Ohtaekwangia koreensis]SKC38588.1 cytochrome c-type biogenesis protein CcmF [Ohtaekwangia koreensis]
MIHYFIGDLGHLFVITSFVAAIITAFAYFKSTTAHDLQSKDFWLLNGKISFYVHAIAVLGICIALYTIIAKHYFEYHYAYSYSDRKLQTYYLISTFWNGQEGSFLLWMFWHTIIGIVLIHTNKFWEGPVMTVFALVQAFLASMILGVVIPGFDVKIGSSPFILLREVMHDAPIFQTQPDFIPKDGNGLNPLLQNYWMVIHPPTLFLGFALTIVPFAFCMAGLWLKKYKDWVRPALPWALFGGAVLGLGILMGGYWAYETLNFGGYWNWDPVENAVYVPWLVLVAAIHTMITYRNSETALKASVILVIATFVLILYSTFLTRSGVLGEASVHSFTDLGLSGQLLVYMFFFLIAAVFLCVVRWKEIPSTKEEASIYSREFWIFIGATTLCLMGFQVIAGTSIPVMNKIMGLINVDSRLAPPADAIGYYSKFQIWFAIALGLLSAIGQFFWWKKIDADKLKKELTAPALITLIVFALIITTAKVYNAAYILLTLAGVFTIVANAKILGSLFKTSPGLSGGAIAHIGVGLMLIGVMFSAGYSKIVSLNNTGMLISKEFSEDFNRDNLLLFVHEPRTMWGYDIEYFGERLEPRYHSGYIRKSDVKETLDKDKVVAGQNIVVNDHNYKAGDTIEIRGENTFFEIELRKGGKKYTLYPRAQINQEMGGLLASPDIYRTVGADLYTHVSSVMNPSEEQEWSKLEEVNVKLSQDFFANDYVTILESVDRILEVEGVPLGKQDVAVKAKIRVQGEHGDYVAEPIFLIKDKLVGRIPYEIKDLGLRFSLLNIHPENGQFTVGINTRQKDWVVIKAMEKPYINILWIGTLVVMVGFGVAMTRRFREFRKMKEKGLE